MHGKSLAIALTLLTACAVDDTPDVSETQQDSLLGFTREHVSGDQWHYSMVVPLGTSPNAKIRVHRVVREIAPFVPRPSAHAALLVHGDFSNFSSNFMPGVAPYLAAHDVDVWGIDRRWTLATTDTSDFGGMTVPQEVSDLHVAIDVARAIRGGGKLALVGFSHGAELAYSYGVDDGRGVNGYVALDFFGAYAPSDADLRAASCANADFERQLVADGVTDGPNDFFVTAGTLDRDDPSGASPLFDGLTNREAMIELLGKTFEFAPITPRYRLLAIDASETAFAHSSQTTADNWLIAAPVHQSMPEAVDLDARLCDDIALDRIHQPVLYIGAEQGVGARGIYTTTRVGSHDTSSFVVPGYGHADLLFAGDAAQRVWQPLAAWLARH